MAALEFRPMYDIGNEVYSLDGDKGKIVDISYNVRGSHVRYNVVFGRREEDDIWVYADEISKDKVVI